jgi:predicted lysophospholipase L1 biosynthesis ABC-type transport system permease subunit
VTDLADQQAKVGQAIQPQADTLALFAALAGLAVLVVIGQLLSRQLVIGASDYPVLSALGTDRRQLFWLAMARAGIVSAAGGCVAVAIAVAASPLMPIGPARLAEPDPGVQVNLAIFGIGLAAVAVLPVLVIAPVAWHAARAGSGRGSGQPAPTAPIRFRAGAPRADISALGRRFVSTLTAAGCPAGTCQALTAAQPAAISNYSRVRTTPLVLGGLLALLAAALTAQALLTTIRRRRREFAVVKTLGFLRWQVLAAVAWEATALTAAALLAGLPLGVAGGRWAWALFAGSVGVGSSATVPLSALLLIIPTALILANAIAASPGWAAARTKPAITLRNE